MNPQKIGGLVILGLGLPFGLYASDRILLCSFLSLGLTLYFFSRERVEDERVRELKMKALFTAISASFGLMLVTHLNYLDFLAAERASRGPSILSAPEFLAIMLLLATGLFHYWRWQDGRAVRTE